MSKKCIQFKYGDTLSSLLNRLWGHVSLKRRRQFGVLFVIMIIASFAEVLSLGAVLPFLSALTVPDRLFQSSKLQFFIHWFGIDTPTQLLLPLTLIFSFAILLSSSLRLLLLWYATKISFATGADLSIDMYRRTLYQPYPIHIARNSSEVIAGISRKSTALIDSIISPLLTALVSGTMLGVMLITLVIVDPMVALAAFSGFGFIYFVIIKLTKKRLEHNSAQIAYESTQVIKSLQEGLGGIRDVLIDGTQEVYCAIYRRADLPLRKAQGSNLFISGSPKFIMESLGTILIVVLAFVLSQQPGGVGSAIPILGAFALGAQRLLPMLQQLYNSWSSIKGGQATLKDALDLLDQPLLVNVDDGSSEINLPINFDKDIELQGVAYRYSKLNPLVLRGINIKIQKGSKVGFMGTTGSGKSTLLDIFIALLTPTAGELKIDGVLINKNNSRNWQRRIAHVPQVIYLADATIAENIAFGTPLEDIDIERVKIAASQAQIAETINRLEGGYHTQVGERGVRLSGGQRQRIGIARALYKQADVIIFDEATSSLDSKTEESVMNAINSLDSNLTILIIAHRLSTLRDCNKIIEIESGVIKWVGSYDDMVKNNDIKIA
jgi:ATP-binding cassette subfamily B protein